MGCSAGDSDCAPDENPAHALDMVKGLWIASTEVTVGAWKRYRAEGGAILPTTDKGGRKFNEEGGDEVLPAVLATWDEANAFCKWSGGRLPTEAEWEYAARAGNPGVRYGNLDQIAWYANNSGKKPIDSAAIMSRDRRRYGDLVYDNGDGPRPVGRKVPNAWNLFDIFGNVEEWVADWYGPRYYGEKEEPSPRGPQSGENKVTRGGSWWDPPSWVRASARAVDKPGTRSSRVGFRCVSEAK
jgi:formylglycine-generating enzyme required for sulfatase activity